ncbi:MAG: hypothetical protein ACRCXT_23300 [Paraclostridium sp.]
MEILKEGIQIYSSEILSIIVCPECCSTLGNSCHCTGTCTNWF